MMNQFQSDRLAAEHRQQLEMEADRARLAQEAVTGATGTTGTAGTSHSILETLGSRALAVGRFLAAPVSRRRTRPGNAPMSM